MTFRVGQKVVCIASKEGWCEPGVIEPGKGDIGTVINVYVGSVGLCLELAEFPAPDSDAYDAGWLAINFRPIVDSRKSVSFTAGAPKDSERWDNRVKKPVRA